MHRVQASRSASTVPNGAAGGSAAAPGRFGAWSWRWSSASRMSVRFSPDGANVAGGSVAASSSAQRGRSSAASPATSVSSAGGVPHRLQDGAGHFNLHVELAHDRGRHRCRRMHDDARPPGDACHPRVHADRTHLLDRPGNHRFGRLAGDARPRFGAAFRIVKQERRRPTARFPVRGQGRAQGGKLAVRRRIGIRHRSGRTRARADSRPLAKIRIDLDTLADGADGAGGAGVDATRAPADAGRPVRAYVRVVAEVAGLLELADEIRRLFERRRQRSLVTAGREVARRENLVLEGRLRAQVDDDVERFASGQRRGGDDDRCAVGLRAKREGPEVSFHCGDCRRE